MHKITYNPQFENPPRKAAVSFNGTKLKPGVTEVTPETLAALRANDGFVRREQIGAIRVDVGESAPPKAIPPEPPPPELTKPVSDDDGLTSLNTADAEVKIKATDDLTTLFKWVEIESAGKNRKMVLADLEDQIKKLQEDNS